MRLPRHLIAPLVLCTLAGCASRPARFRDQAFVMLERVKHDGGKSLFPAEFASTLDALRMGDALVKENEPEDAEQYYYLTLMKARLMEKELRLERVRQQQAARLAEEQKKAAAERLAAEEAARQAQAKAEALARKETVEATHKKSKAPKEQHVLVSSYTVRRGESLPLIAAQPEVYGDRNLWPLIYRANRDQISDPHHIWPGQVFKVPRNLGRDDIAEARRYAQERPIH